MPREYFCAYHSYLKNMNRLKDDERGRLFTALLTYSMTGEEPEINGNEAFVFDGIKEDIRRSIESYDKKVNVSRENGKKGGRPKNPEVKTESKKNPVGFSKTQKTQEEEEEEEKEEYIFKDLRPLSPQSATPYRQIIELYNSICISLPKAVSVSEQRKVMLNARYREVNSSLDEMRSIFERIEASDFLCGRTETRKGKAFRADFGWIIRPTNFEKIREGRYDNRPDGQKESSMSVNGERYAPTFDISEVEKMLDAEWLDSE